MTEVRFLASDDVSGLASMVEYIDVVEQAYAEHGVSGGAEQPSIVRPGDGRGRLISYGAVLPESGAMASYVYSSGFTSEDAWFVTPVFDPETGQLLAIIDGASMNPLKTAAVGGVAADFLARPDATVATVIGSGPQAFRQVEALATVRQLDRVNVYSRTAAHRRVFAEAAVEEFGLTVVAVDDLERAVSEADVVVTATTASAPVFDGDWLREGTHVTAMGQNQPDSRELDVTTIRKATYVPDIAERVVHNAGSFIRALSENAIAVDHVHASLGEVVAGSAPGRESEAAITVFDSCGTGIETAAAARMLYDKASDLDLGTPIRFTSMRSAIGSAPVDRSLDSVEAAGRNPSADSA